MKHLKLIKKTAEQTILHTGGHYPQLVCSNQNDELMAVGMDFPDSHQGKRLVMLKAGNEVGKQFSDIDEVYFISEAWTSKAKDGKIPDVRPSQDPNRVECLLIHCCDLGAGAEKSKLLLYDMIRDKKGNLTELKSRSDEDKPDEIDSPLMDAFVVGYRAGVAGDELEQLDKIFGTMKIK